MRLLLVVLLAASAADLRAAQKLLTSRDPEDRAKGVGMLGGIPGPASVRLILGALTDEDATVRARARRAVASRRAPEELELIADRGLRHPDPRVRQGSLNALVSARVPNIESHLSHALADRDPRIREAAAGHIASFLGGRGIKVLAAAIPGRGEGRPRASALLALHRIAPDRAVEMASALTGDPAYEVRVAALEVLASRGDHRPLIDALADDDWSVRLTAVKVLPGLSEIEAIPALIASLGRERGRMRQEVYAALADLTGMGFAPDPEPWERWWEGAKGSFELPERTERAARPAEDTVATFHDIPVTSEAVAFVLDRSASMRRRLKKSEDVTKADLVARELRQTLEKLEPPARFLLVSFGTEPRVLSKKPVKATGCARTRALKWFSKGEPSGRTNLYDSLAIALDRPDVDTIFLLTDGAPSEGEYCSRGEILLEVGKLNRYRQAVIHTVEIGGGTIGKRWKGFMRELAESTGGVNVRR